jgi:metallophosphoesterase (TIGR00282 family)
MKILYCGDVVGRSGRDALKMYIPQIKAAHNLDIIVINGENAAHGFGITPGICNDLYELGVNVITLGNHSFDNKEIIKIIDQDTRVIRPVNGPSKWPGRGFTFINLPNNKQFMVVNVLGQMFMSPLLNDPFEAIDNLLKKYPMGGMISGILIDMHAEASSEKMGMGHFCDGRVSMVVGSHTHIPTADAHILEHKTGYITDAGMCGDYNSMIGMNKSEPIYRFTNKMQSGNKMTPADGPGTICGVIADIDDQTGLCNAIFPVRLGAHLINTGL